MDPSPRERSWLVVNINLSNDEHHHQSFSVFMLTVINDDLGYTGYI